MSTQRVWFSESYATFLSVTFHSPGDTVTGASSGFGLSLTTHVLEQGDVVIATLRKPETLKHLSQTWTEGQLLILKVDVSNPDDIKDAFRTAEIRFGRIDVVYNNAGFSVMGELESTPEEEARKMFDVNVWGAINVAREAIRFFRDVNKSQGGRLWSVSSGAGLLPIPAFGYYCASKFGTQESIS
jgi:NAD(P)-dependent dehydrogenase (short-subunit alcohol dehydrogenase family)